MTDESDAELVELARAGDKEAFGRLAARYEGLARRIALRLVGETDLAGEVVQEALLEAYLSLRNLRDGERFRAWLCSIVLNVGRAYFRRHKKGLESLESLAGGLPFEAIQLTGPDPHAVAEMRELHRAVLGAISFLSASNRTAVLMFYYDGLSLSEIAAGLGISQAAVKGRLHKARRELHKRLLPFYLELSENQIIQRRQTMVKVTIAGIVQQEITDYVHFAVLLLDEAGRRILPIWIGEYEGTSIALALSGQAVPRPMTYSFTASLLEAAEVRLEEVRVESLREETFFAIAKINTGKLTREIDARPSDALALALAVKSDCPIYAAEDVLARASVAIPEGVDFKAPIDKAMQKILAEIARVRQEKIAAIAGASNEESRKNSRETLIGIIFGPE